MSFGNNLLGIVKNLLFFKRRPADIYHVTGQIHYIALRLPSDKTVLTIHDLGFLHTRKGLRRFVLKKLFLDWPLKKLKFITAVSQKTKDEIIAYTDCSSDKIHVIENPLSEIFIPPEQIKPFDKSCPVILQIGATPNKNVSKLIEAIVGLSCKLVLVGRVDDELKLLLQKNKIDFEIKERLNQEGIVDEYNAADIVTFCSTYEGFGLPVIEAQTMCKCVVTSNISPMKDVAGGSAVLVDPNNAVDIRRGISELIENDELREKLIRDGLENIKRFDSKKIGKMYENYYSTVLGESKLL
jgi:glycosyltransferase involved in cell wall biosynthesis